MSSRVTPRQFGLVVLVASLSLFAEFAGYFSQWNARIGDTRMALSQRASNGQTIFVAVDPQSLAAIGTWPWSRAIHADLLDRIIDAGARDVFFDFDFTFASDTGGDLAFERALERAGGATYLAVFAQSATTSDPLQIHHNVPLPAFARNSWPALVNVQTDAQGIVRYYPYGAPLEDGFVLSAGTLLANAFHEQAEGFEIDFSIEPNTIPTVSAIEVLRGTVPAKVFADRSVIIGASAIELSDQLAVPVHGIVAGPLIHALATETLSAGRNLRWVRAEGVGIALGMALLLLCLHRRGRPLVLLGGATLIVVTVEIAALWAFRTSGVMFPSAMLFAGLMSFVAAVLVTSIRSNEWLLLKTSAQARNRLRVLERVFDDGIDGLVVLDVDGEILRHSASAEKMFGTNEAGTLQLPDRLRRASPLPASTPLQTIEVRGPDGLKVLEYRVARSTLERPTALGHLSQQDEITTLVLRDITRLHEHEQDIAYLSNYDDRTGALRRNAFLVFLGLRLEGGRDAVVFALTLERIKTINVTLGRAVGDAILKEVVSRIERSPLLLSAPVRLGGTSFAVFTESSADLSLVREMAQELLDDIASVYRLEDATAQVGVRIGYTTILDRSGIAADLALDQAIEALDTAKSTGAPIAQYDQAAWEKQKRAREIERAMEYALENGEFRMLYQPQYRVSDGTLVGAEALVRWTSPTLGEVYPDEFIGIAESTGFIVEFGNWTIKQSAKDAQLLPPDVVIAVNVSAIQIMRGSLVEDTTRILSRVGLPPERICFELTETVMLASSDYIIEMMQDLRFIGITWALDDFGTGFSSMEYLSRMPLDKVKLDKSFIMKLGEDPTARPILHATSELCRGLGVKLLCEGVETQEHLSVLVEEGCDEAQGYLFGKPQPIEELLSASRKVSRGVR